jgi:cytochrome b6-f complex iron-sulfur subunit
MADSKKPSTADILNLLRKPGAGDAPAAKAETPSEPPPAQEAVPSSPEPAPLREPLPSETAKPAKPAGKPTDIMAAIRAGGGPAAPKAEAPAKPGGTADILAAARAKAPAAGGDKPKTSADILAAAKGGGAPKAAAKEGAPKEAAAKPAAKAKAEVSGRDPKELVQALRSGKPSGGAAVAEAPKKPKLPSPKTSATAAAAVPRRGFAVALVEALASPFIVGWAVFAFVVGLLSPLLMARFMMPNTVLELPSRFKIGPPSDFPPESVSEKFKAARGVWIVNTAGYNGEQMIYALASVCTHLGCTPNWLEGEQKFKCPCHGSGFYITGINFEGPAPRPLERVGISVAADGMLEVDKSMKFQEELGQWADGKSYHAV